MRRFPLLIVVLILLALPAAAQEGDFTPFQRPGANGGPTEVEIYVFILDIDRIDTQHQSLEINLAYGARWNDPREAHDGEGSIVKPLQSVWHPNLQILSQQRAWSTMPEAVRIAPDGSVAYGQRVWGSFTQRFDLRDFPLDSQTVELQVVSAGNGPTDLRFVGSTSPPSTVAEQLSVTDWDLVSVRSEANEVTYVAGYRPSPGFQLSFAIERRIGFFVAKVIIPLILIVAMSWIVFWIDPKEGAVQINVAITSMLTLIAYRFAIGSTLPLVSYLTRLDYLILLATILVFASLMEVIVVVRMARRAETLERARTIDRRCRWIFPGTFFVLGAASLALRIGS